MLINPDWWLPLLETALLGTERRPFDYTLLPPALHLPDAPIPPERSLLQTAAMAGAYLRAGAEPLPIALPVLPVCPPETKPYAPREAIQVLDALSQEQTINRRLLGLLLTKCRDRSWLIPPDRLPDLLSIGYLRQAYELHEVVLAVIGERGRWLATVNPAWQYAAPANDPTLLESGTTADRRAAFRRLRRSDPAQARDWLETIWSGEPTKNRVEWVRDMDEAGRNRADEPFLMRALAEVQTVKQPRDIHRSLATELTRLLLSFPDGDLFGQTRQHLSKYVRQKRNLLLQSVRAIDLPRQTDAFLGPPDKTYAGSDTAWVRRAFIDYVAIIHPAVWPLLLDQPVPQCIHTLRAAVDEAASGPDWMAASLQRAVVRHGLSDWAAELVPLVSVDDRGDLLALLPPAQWEARLSSSSDWLQHLGRYGSLTAPGAPRWSLAFSRFVVAELTGIQARQYQLNPAQRQFATDLPTVLHPDTFMDQSDHASAADPPTVLGYLTAEFARNLALRGKIDRL